MKVNSVLIPMVLVAGVAQAQTVTVDQALTRLFSASELQAEWFAPDFLKAVPFSTIQTQLLPLITAQGKFQRMDTYQGKPIAVFETGTLVINSVQGDAQGRFQGLFFAPGPAPQILTSAPTPPEVGVNVLTKLLTSDPLDLGLFSPEFLKAVPAEQLKIVLAQSFEPLGAFKNVTTPSGGWQINFEKGSLKVTQLAVNEAGQFTALVFQPVVTAFNNLDEAKAAFTALPGEVSVFVTEVGQAPLLSVKATRPLAVGSTFKLAILGALQAQINAGTLKWTDELTLTDADKSLPTGTLQNALAGSQYTLQDLATRMIRDSDNTATDLLLNRVGREAAEARLGQPAMPSTREAFALKNPANLDLLRAYRAAGLNTPARRDVLKQASTAALPDVSAFSSGHTLARDVEWFASTQHLCALMKDVAAQPAMQVNPGLVNKTDYASVSYKGGSEPGVLNLTTQVTTTAGKTYCVSATWNRAERLDDNNFFVLYQRLMAMLR